MNGGLLMAHFLAVPVTTAEFDSGGTDSPVFLWFCEKVIPSDCLFISVLRYVQFCSFLLLQEFSCRHDPT